MDQILFQQACNKVIDNIPQGHEIGTLSEKTMQLLRIIYHLILPAMKSK